MVKAAIGSVKRFGSRYGSTVRRKFGEIELLRRAKYTCPYCRAKRIKRLAAGIWFCTKCKSKFTGMAYTISKKRKEIRAE